MTSQEFLDDAIHRQLTDPSGWTWTWFRCMSAKDQEDFDKWLVEIEDPLSHMAGTPQSRFEHKVRTSHIS